MTKIDFYEKLIKCTIQLLDSPFANKCKEYVDSRISIESQVKYELGYFPSLKNISIINDYFDIEELKKMKLIFERDIGDSLFPRKVLFSFFDNYELIMPFKDAYGVIVALVGRTLLSETERVDLKIPKYKNTIFRKGNFLFGLYENCKEIYDQKSVYVVEGQFDVIKASEYGINNIVALGNSNMSQYQFSMLLRYTDNIFLLLDNDSAGEKGRQVILDKYGRYANIKNVYLPNSYKDIDDFFKTNTFSDFQLLGN